MTELQADLAKTESTAAAAHLEHKPLVELAWWPSIRDVFAAHPHFGRPMLGAHTANAFVKSDFGIRAMAYVANPQLIIIPSNPQARKKKKQNRTKLPNTRSRG
jgi:hypothetical protein